jgi:hypothetical protein
VLANQMLDLVYSLADSVGTYLFVIADDDDLIAHVQRDQCHRVALAGFVDDHHIEARRAEIEAFYHARQGIIQTSTAVRHSFINARAVARSCGTRLPVPLPIFLTVCSQPTNALRCCKLVRRTCARPGAAVDKLRRGPLQVGV